MVKTMNRLLVTMVLLSCIPPFSVSTTVSGTTMSTTTVAASTCQPTFVFVHGAAHGAWCWYKIVTMLQEANHAAVALDLTSAGKNKASAGEVTSIAQYAKPLTDYLSNLEDDCKVILVGHSLGGISVSYAMEAYPEKIDKAIFLSALMPRNGETAVQTINGAFVNLEANGIFQLQHLGGSSPVTSVALNLTAVPIYCYNKSPVEDINLALSLLNETPFEIINEVLTLTPEKYGSIDRFYVMCGLDKMMPFDVQLDVISRNPPKQKFILKDSDHSAFFSDVPNLFNVLRKIAQFDDNLCTVI